MPPDTSPNHTPESVRVVHRLRYDWCAWWRVPSVVPDGMLDGLVEACRPQWATDGMVPEAWRLLDDPPGVQILFGTQPGVSPAFCAHRAKGRLLHAAAGQGKPLRCRRNLGLRSLGDNTRETVEAYVARQAGRSDYVDPRFKDFLRTFTAHDARALLDAPAATAHGRYWYNLHLVLVVADRRFPVTRRENFDRLFAACFRIAEKKGHGLASVSVMPDHIHLALRGQHEQSPLGIGLAYLNNLARIMGCGRFWSEEFYVGTFGEYSVAQLPGRSRSP